MEPAILPAMIDAPVTRCVVSCVNDCAGKAIEKEAICLGANLVDVAAQWQALLDAGKAVVVPAGAVWRVLIDLGRYHCFWTRIAVSGGLWSRVEISAAESLMDTPGNLNSKSRRDLVDGKFYMGTPDVLLPDGGTGRVLEPLWWRCGRFVQLLVRVGEQPLIIEGLTLRETRYPTQPQQAFRCDDASVQSIAQISLRTLQMCSHETYMDCPYYEQLMYAGDTRIQSLITMAIMHDDRLPRKALKLFDASRLNFSELTTDAYPCSSGKLFRRLHCGGWR